jgi:hypothetical protein
MYAPCGEILHDSYPTTFLGASANTTSLEVLLCRVVVPLKDHKGLMASDRHNLFVIPSFPDLSHNKRMPEVMKAQVR